LRFGVTFGAGPYFRAVLEVNDLQHIRVKYE
jgi:hypothetical protein